MECTQVWGYDNLVEFQATQQDLSSQIGRTPALSFCPTCGIFLLDTGSTQGQRDAHIQSCRDVEDPEGFEVVSEGEDSDVASDDTATASGRGIPGKKQRTATGTEQQNKCNQENSLAPASEEVQAMMPPGISSELQLPSQRPAAGLLTEATSANAAADLGQNDEEQVRGLIIAGLLVPQTMRCSCKH